MNKCDNCREDLERVREFSFTFGKILVHTCMLCGTKYRELKKNDGGYYYIKINEGDY